jgi:hypothetical protein
MNLQEKQLEEFKKMAFPVMVPGWWSVRYAMIAPYGKNLMVDKFISDYHPHYFVITTPENMVEKCGLFCLVDFPDQVYPVDIERKDQNGHFRFVGDIALYSLPIPNTEEKKIISSGQQRKDAFDGYVKDVYGGKVPKHLENLQTDINTNLALEVLFEAKRRETIYFERMARWYRQAEKQG